MMRFRILWILTLAVLLTGCIQPDEDHTEIDSRPVDLIESQNEVMQHLKTIIESQNQAITSFNNREYAACLTECEQLKKQNDEYASSIESFADLVMEAPLSESGRRYYRIQLSILYAIHHDLNQSVSGLYSACDYAIEGRDEDARYHIQRASRYIDVLYANIGRFNANIDAFNRGSWDLASPVPEPETDEAPPEKTTLTDIPDPYYLNKTPFQNTPDEIKRLLGMGFFTPYQCSRFDCSEMAAYIEWKLECHNITAYIATKDDWEGGYGHAWVIVPLRNGKYLAIEPTISAAEGSFGAEMITTDPRYFDYDHLFEDIYCASEFFGEEEWDWWNNLELK